MVTSRLITPGLGPLNYQYADEYADHIAGILTNTGNITRATYDTAQESSYGTGGFAIDFELQWKDGGLTHLLLHFAPFGLNPTRIQMFFTTAQPYPAASSNGPFQPEIMTSSDLLADLSDFQQSLGYPQQLEEPYTMTCTNVMMSDGTPALAVSTERLVPDGTDVEWSVYYKVLLVSSKVRGYPGGDDTLTVTLRNQHESPYAFVRRAQLLGANGVATEMIRYPVGTASLQLEAGQYMFSSYGFFSQKVSITQNSTITLERPLFGGPIADILSAFNEWMYGTDVTEPAILDASDIYNGEQLIRDYAENMEAAETEEEKDAITEQFLEDFQAWLDGASANNGEIVTPPDNWWDYVKDKLGVENTPPPGTGRIRFRFLSDLAASTTVLVMDSSESVVFHDSTLLGEILTDALPYGMYTATITSGSIQLALDAFELSTTELAKYGLDVRNNPGGENFDWEKYLPYIGLGLAGIILAFIFSKVLS